MFGLGKKKVAFAGDVNHLITKHSADKYGKGQVVEVPKGYDVIMIASDGTIESLKNAFEFKLKDKIKYVYYVKSTKTIMKGNWGTPARISVKEKGGSQVTLGAYGTFEFRLVNAIKFINTSMTNIEFVDEGLLTELVLARVVEVFQQVVREIKVVDQEEINDLTLLFKEKVTENLNRKLDDSGIEMVEILIENLNIQPKQ